MAAKKPPFLYMLELTALLEIHCVLEDVVSSSMIQGCVFLQRNLHFAYNRLSLTQLGSLVI